jgi:signal transduction histidine kinase
VAGLAADITDLKETQEQSRQQQRLLIQADKMASLGVLVSGIAHEINNPNNLVMLNSDLVSRIIHDVMPALDEFHASRPEKLVGGLPYKETREEFEGLLQGISFGSQRIRDIVIGLREFARTDGGNMDQQVHINEVVNSALLIVGNLIRKSTDAFTVQYGDEIPAIVGNAQQIEQVIINLLTNACHALVEKTQAITVNTRYNISDKKIEVIVSDKGIGIPVEHQERLFDPFFTTKRDRGGTGLGLPISYSIIEAHKGELQITSAEGIGTTVTIALPCSGMEKGS